MNRVFKSSILFLVAALAGCGGDGSESVDNGSGTKPPVVVSPISITVAPSIQLDELVSKSVEFSLTGDVSPSDEYSVTPPLGITASFSSSGLVVKSDEVNKDTNYILVVKVKGKTNTVEKSITVTVKNTSATPIIAFLTEFYSKGSTFISMDEEKKVLKTSLTLQSATGEIEESKVSEQLNKVKSFVDLNSSGIALFHKDVKSTVEEYQAGATDANLILSYQKAMTDIPVYAKLKLETLNALLAETSSPLPVFSENMEIKDYLVFSSFYGNKKTGEMKDGKWIYAGQFEFLNTLLSNECAI